MKKILDFLLKSPIVKTDKNGLLSKYSEIEKLLELKTSRKYEFFYLNKVSIHQILFDEEKIIKIQSNTQEKNLYNLFYIILLIKHKPYLINYIYEYKFIENVNNLRKNTNDEILRLLLSKIVIELIDNYKEADIYYNEEYEKELNEMFEENKKVSDINIINRNELKLIKKAIELNNIEEIYYNIIIILLKENKFENVEESQKILEQLDLQEINITEEIYDKLLLIFNDMKNNSYLEKYTINDINDLYREQNINFYFIIFKYIFKNPVHVYNISFLNKSRNVLLKIIKLESDKIAEKNKNVGKNIRIKLDYVIQAFCNSNYYFGKYLGENFSQLKQIFIYYINYLFYSKQYEIQKLNNLFNDINVEVDYKTLLDDFKKAEYFNLIYPIIKYIYEEDKKNEHKNKNEKNEKNENDINNCIKKWEEIEKKIKNKIIKTEDKIIVKKYFDREDFKEILIQVFGKDIYEYINNEINNEKNNVINNEINKSYNNIHDINNINVQEQYETEIKISEGEIPNTNTERIEKKENENNTKQIMTDNTIFNQDNKTKTNISKIGIKSNATIVYNSEIHKNEIIFDENECYLLSYLNTIGTHEKSADFTFETNNGLMVSGGGDENLLIYNQEYNNIMSINNKDWISNISEIKDETMLGNNQKQCELIALSKQQIHLIQINAEEMETRVIKDNIPQLYSPNVCLNVHYGYTLFGTDNGIYFASDIFSKIISPKIINIEPGVYRGGIVIDDKIVAFTSNQFLKRGKDIISFFNIYSKKIINNIKGYSFVTSRNGLSLMTVLENSSKKKVLLCACKKYNPNQKNGILLIDTDIKFKKKINRNFYNTRNYEVYCFCPIKMKIKGHQSIFNETKNFIDTNYFLVGGYEKKKGKGILKLYKLNMNENDENINIEFIQDVQFKKGGKFMGFNGPISCITQSKRNGKIIISCWDGNVYLFSYPKIETFINYDKKTKFDCMLLMVEKEKNDIVVDI